MAGPREKEYEVFWRTGNGRFGDINSIIMIIAATISVLFISGGVYLVRKKWPIFRICPVCAGVSLTWGWMLLAYYLGYSMNLTILGILMGGSVVGVAYQLEKRLPSERGVIWKIIFVPAGLVMAHGLIELSWLYLILSSAVIGITLYIFFFTSGRRLTNRKDGSTSDIEDKMKNCC